jgi:hypothetical protein
MVKDGTGGRLSARSFSRSIAIELNNANKASRNADRPTEATREFAQQGAAYSKDVYEKSKATAEETNKALQQTYSTVAKGAADFSVQWIEMVRANTNSTLDFVWQLD